MARKLVSITLDNRKTYVGYVTDAPNLDPQDSFVRLIPFLSGYRDHDTLELKFTTSYDRLYDLQIDPSDCSVTVPILQIRMVSFFHEQLYDKFAIETDQPADAAMPAAG